MTEIIAHRGSKGTHPENTLAAFAEAIRVGADGIELDVQLSKDNQLVVIHDKTVNRTTNGQGNVGQMTLSQLKELDAGSWFKPNSISQTIPTLVEVLTLLDNQSFNGRLNIEIKTDEVHYDGIERLVVQQLQQQNWLFDYIYSSFYFPSLEKIWALDQTKELAYIFYNQPITKLKKMDSEMIKGFHPKINWLRSCHNAPLLKGKHLRPWTVNDTKDMLFCFRESVAGFHTDYPEKAKKLQQLIKMKENKR